MADTVVGLMELAGRLQDALADPRLEALELTWHGEHGPFSAPAIVRWEQLLARESSDRTVIHNLAVLYLCRAADEEFAGRSEVARELWRRMWRMWGVLLPQQEFWDGLEDRFSGNPFFADVQWSEVQREVQRELLRIHVELAIHHHSRGQIEWARYHREFITSSPCDQDNKAAALKSLSDELAAGIPTAIEAGEYEAAFARAMDYVSVMGTEDERGVEMLLTAAVELGRRLWTEANDLLGDWAEARRKLVELLVDCRPLLCRIVDEERPSSVVAQAAARLCLWTATALVQEVAAASPAAPPYHPHVQPTAGPVAHARAWLEWARRLDMSGELKGAISEREDMCLEKELRAASATLLGSEADALRSAAAQAAAEAEEKASKLSIAPRSYLVIAALWRAAGDADKEKAALERAEADAYVCEEPELAEQARRRLDEIGGGE